MVPIGDTFARTGAVQFDFPPGVVFRALTEALPGLKGIRVLDSNALARHVSIATAVSAWSWGERVTVSVTEVGPGKSAMSIASATKTMIGSAASHSKNRKNVELLIRATSDVLARSGAQWTAAAAAMGATPVPAQAAISSPSRLEQLKTLGELRDSGVLTAEEFETEKARIIESGAPLANSPTGMPPSGPADLGVATADKLDAGVNSGLEIEVADESQASGDNKDSETPPPQPNEPGWHPVVEHVGLQAYWDGQQWSAYSWWDGQAWIPVQPTA